MTALSFMPSRFSSNTELDVLVVCFLVGSGDYVLFQQGLTEHAGLNEPPYFEFNDQLYGGVGLVRSCVVTRSQIIIELSQPMNGFTRILIGLAELQADYQDIIAQLRNIFVSTDGVLSIEQA